MAGMPTRIGRYTVARELGSGGMGEVFLAYSLAGDPVAVKVIRSDKLDPVTRARFEKEALIARTVVGTNRVARFLDADPYADRPWLAMEYVPGRTLLACIDDGGPLPLPLVVSLGALLAEGLAAVHAAGLLHRDLKPQNVMLGGNGPMIIDFGLGAFMDASAESLSHSGMIVGSVRCMPPEQASGHPHVNAAADVYALGTVLLYAAAGHYPYDGSMWEAVAAQVANPKIAPNLTGVPAGLLPLLASMLAYDPQDRPTLEAIAHSCADLLATSGIAPAQARLALIAHTTAGGTAGTAEVSLPSSIEKLIAEQTAGPDTESLASPLDAPPGVDEEPDGQEQSLPAPPAGQAVAPQPHPRSARLPASQRVSEELRTQYAVQAAL